MCRVFSLSTTEWKWWTTCLYSYCLFHGSFYRDLKILIMPIGQINLVGNMTGIFNSKRQNNWSRWSEHPRRDMHITKNDFRCTTLIVLEQGWFGQPKCSTPLKNHPTLCRFLLLYSSFWICIWGQLRQGDHMFIVIHRFLTVLHFQNIFRPHENAKLAFWNTSVSKSVFGKVRFRDNVVWTISLTVEIKPRFQLPPT